MVIEWREYPEHPRYSVSSNGDVIGPRGTVMKWQFNKKNGYFWLKIQTGPGEAAVTYVHYIVCRTFHGPRPDGHQTRHLDDDKSNCSASNLCWGTPAENMSDLVANGRSVLGMSWAPKGGKRVRKN